jgi:hypothetical protein
MATPDPAMTAFDVELEPDEEAEFTEWLCREIENAISARAQVVQDGGDLDYYWALYEVARTRIGKDAPWPGAADLTSPIGPEKVDALKARIMRTIFVEPMFLVDGFGKDAEKAPYVEEFHQWKLKRERFARYVGRAVLNGLVEGTGVIEISERAEARKVRERRRVKIQTAQDGGWLLHPKTHKPQLTVDDQGRYVDAESGDPWADTIVDRVHRMNGGPQYRVPSLKDFFILPGHAADESEIFGYVKRVWLRWPDIQRRAKDGVYQNVDALGGDLGERDQTPALMRSGTTIPTQQGPTAEKELFEVPVLYDFDGAGLEAWYIATVSIKHRKLLRLRHDDIGQSRFQLLTPLPRADSPYGYSLIGHKLITIIEDNTATNNMIADRSAMASSAPLKRVMGAVWDADVQPFGPRSIIDVRDPNEITQMEIADVPASAFNRVSQQIASAQRVTGENDIASGVQPEGDPTLGQVNLVAQQSFVRMDEMVRYIQESLEVACEIRHLLYIRQLQAMAAKGDAGMPAPSQVMKALQARGAPVPDDGQFTAEMLQGQFTFKAHGSVETADVITLRADFNGFLQALAILARTTPAIASILNQPSAAKALFEQCLRVYRFQDRQAFFGSAWQALISGQPQADAATPGQPGPPQLGPPSAPPPGPPGLPPPALPGAPGASAAPPINPAIAALIHALPGALLQPGGSNPAPSLQ